MKILLLLWQIEYKDSISASAVMQISALPEPRVSRSTSRVFILEDTGLYFSAIGNENKK